MGRAGFLLSLLALGFALAEAQEPPSPPALSPAITIPVTPLGFRPPSMFYLPYRASSGAMGFLDEGHLLFTFHTGALMKRIPDDPAEDEDQTIRAVVLDLATGKAVRQAEWRMHDHNRYLWPMQGGKFLVRERNTLFLTDASLELKPYLESRSRLLAVYVSPDRDYVTVETGESAPETLHHDWKEERDAPKNVEVSVMRADTQAPLVSSRTRRAVVIPTVRDGFLETLPGDSANDWIIRRVTFQGAPTILASIRSACEPAITPVSATVVIAGCIDDGSDHQVFAFTTDGQRLWQQWWQARYIWRTFDDAENGTRFALSSLVVSHPLGTLEPLSDADIQRQLVGVFDTETGKLVVLRDADPVFSAGQNFALSQDGRRFAILRQGGIEIYDLPPVGMPEPVPVQKKKQP